MIEATIIIVWSIFLLVWIPRIFRNSIFEVHTATGAWWPLWLYKEFLLVLPAPMLLALFGVKAFPTTLLVAKDAQTFNISFLVLYAITFFFVTLALAIRIIPRKWLTNGIDRPQTSYKKVNRFALIAIMVGMCIMAVGILFLNFHNALIDALVSGKVLMNARLSNKYATALPSQVQFVILVAAWIAAIHGGYSYAWGRRAMAGLCLISGVVLAGANGGKSPIVTVFLLAGTGYLVAKRQRIATRIILNGLLIGLPALFILMYFVVSLQMPGLTFSGFLAYLVDRIGMAQMAGTYDGIALGPLHGAFYWHMVPFANLFENYIPYDKLLMMQVEGYDFADVGVKNSFFISEAYGIGGYALVLASPFIVALTYAAATALTYVVMKWMFSKDVAGLYFLPISILYLNVTGGFSPFPLFKGFLLMVLVLGVFWIPHFVISLLPRKRNYNAID